jgi:hypothetical protein
MKKFLLFGLFALSSIILLAQNTSLVIFSEDGDPFQLLVNGVVFNEDAQSNVKLEGLNPSRYSVKLVFEDPEIGDLHAYVNLREKKEMTYIVKKRKVSDEEKLALVTLQNIMRDFNLKDREEAEAKKAEIEKRNEVYSLKLFTETDRKKSARNKKSSKIEEINKNAGVNETASARDMETVVVEEVPVAAEQKAEVSVESIEPFDEGNCASSMDDALFNESLKSIKKIGFDDQRLATVEDLINSHCLKVEQSMQLINLFTFENTRLELAKLSYSHIYDQYNFEQMYSLFSFESSREELRAFVESTK